MTVDLWGNVLDREASPDHPTKLLQAQAELLSRKTRGALVGLVEGPTPESGRLASSLLVQVPAIHYSLTLLRVEYPPEIFPVTVVNALDGSSKRADNDEELRASVGAVLQSERTTKAIAGLRAHGSPGTL